MKFVKISALSMLLMVLTIVTQGQNQSPRENQGKTPIRSSLNRLSENVQVAPAAGSNPVTGSGQTGRITKWIGVDGTNSYALGSTGISEDKFGKVGIGTPTPTSPLTVVGMIETTLGGYKFPDGTVQTSAGISPSQVIKSLNGLKGDVQLAAGSNITITPTGNTLTISAQGLLNSVTTNATLSGNGTNGSPLGVAVPLALTGATANVPLVSITQSGSERVLLVNASGNDTEVPAIEVNQSGLGKGILSTTNRFSIHGISHSVSGAGLFAENTGGGVAIVGRTNGGTTAVGAVLGRNDGLGYGVQGLSTADNGISVFGDGGRFGAKSIAGRFEQISTTNPMSALEVSTIGLGYALHIDSTSNDPLANGGLFVTTDNGKAGTFEGDVEITGNLSATGMKNFKIDHPLDPENKYLYHASIESSEVLNLYTGNITTDANGDAVVEMPEWFEALNKDFRYQLTVIGTFAQAIVAEKIKGNRFVIKTNGANVEVSWQVTGVRNDLSIKKHPMQVEVEKSKTERGYYLQPELYNQPTEKGIEFARNPEMMKRMKNQKEEKDTLQQRPKLASDN